MTRLAEGRGFAVDDVSIRVEATSWSKPETNREYCLVFVRRGTFKLRLRNWEVLADPSVAYVTHPGDDQRIAHKVGAEDRCTAVRLSWPVLADVVRGEHRPPAGPLFTSGRVDLAHRMLVARARRGADEFELTDRVLRLAGDMLYHESWHPERSPVRSTARGRIVEAAREVLVQDPATLGLADVASQVSASPAYLSRVFRQETGETLTRFRNRLRVRRVLDRIEAGETSISRLAAELGFADHAHLTRTVRQEVGFPPILVRRMLALGECGQGSAAGGQAGPAG